MFNLKSSYSMNPLHQLIQAIGPTPLPDQTLKKIIYDTVQRIMTERVVETIYNRLRDQKLDYLQEILSTKDGRCVGKQTKR